MCVCVCVCVCAPSESCLTICNPMELFPPGSCPWNFPGKNTGVSCCFLLQDLPDPGIELVSLASAALAGRLFTTRAIWEATMSFVNPGVLFLPPLWWREGLGSANAWVWGGDSWSGSPFHRETYGHPPEWPRSHPSGHKAVSGLVTLVCSVVSL